MKDNKKLIKNLVIAIILFAILFFGYKFFQQNQKEVVDGSQSSYQLNVLQQSRSRVTQNQKASCETFHSKRMR